MRVLVGAQTPPFITLTDQKLELIESHGPNATLVIHFTRELAALSPEEFVKTYLVDGLNVRELVIGYDYHMGKGRSGDFATLSALGRKYGFDVFRLDPVTCEGAVVSSTRIRDLVQAGEVWEARPLLSRFYQVAGEVVHGMDRGGKLLGFPTANLKLVDELVPKRGVYAIWVELDGHCLPAVANIGTNPTFGNDAVSVEAHLLDFEGDLYGRRHPGPLRAAHSRRAEIQRPSTNSRTASAEGRSELGRADPFRARSPRPPFRQLTRQRAFPRPS